MASLTGQPISASYNGLLKTSANTALTGTGTQAITDGDGNNSPISLSQSEIYITCGATGNIEITGDLVTITDDAQATGFQITAGAMDFAGNVDFSGATVTGLPGGGGGLTSVSDTTVVSGSGPSAGDAIYHTVTIPAGTFTSGDIVTYRSLLDTDLSSGGWLYWAAWVSNSTGLFSGKSLGGGAIANGIPSTLMHNKTFVIHSADGSGDGTDYFSGGYAVEQSEPYGNGDYSDTIGLSMINWNNTVYINFSYFIDNAGNFVRHRGTTLTKINS